LGSGAYFRTGSWSLGQDVSGNSKFQVTFKKWRGTDVPTIHGGLVLQDWVRSSKYPGKPVWEVPWTRTTITRHLYKGDQRLRRARVRVPTDLRFNADKTGFANAPASWASWSEPKLVEFVFRPVGKMFTEHRCTVSQVTLSSDGSSSTVLLKQPCFSRAQQREVDAKAISSIEHVAQGLDQNDEWVCSLEDKKIYYYSSTSLSSSFSLTASITQTLMQVLGASYITFQGIRFQFSEWLQVNADSDGYVEKQNGWFLTSSSTEQVSILGQCNLSRKSALIE